jgi:hypothetical protein
MRAASKIGVAVGLIVVATTALAACGQISANGTTSRSGASQAQPGEGSGARRVLLCGQPHSVTEVRVVRIDSRAELGQTKPLPRARGITIKDPAAVRQLAMMICKLPTTPQGVINCPLDNGGAYVLKFAASSERFSVVTLSTSGCETVTGTEAGRAKWVMTTPSFWQQFAHLTGITAPARAGA